MALTLFSSCHNSVGPGDNSQPGQRNYTWYVDTINAAGNILRSVDGVSDSNVWAVSSAGDFRLTIFHFDGTKWTTDSINRPISPDGVRVFSANNGWMVGQDGRIWTNTGTGWNQQAKIAYGFLEDIDGYAGINLYTVGEFFDNTGNAHPIIYRQSGSSWVNVNFKDIPDCGFNNIRFYAPGKSLIWVWKSLPDGSAPDSNKIFCI